ncbi:ankyrin repeat [Thraustotheca clavata]|uniref:Ankyrin repeat n=1 Tax=Thraustotheca clavata TaxID=74557 RepID=A0A1W0A5B1_9STRA|nr:ankyrin repeat [Thraustotheca clavata]
MHFDDEHWRDKRSVDKITLYRYHAAAVENLWLDELQEFVKYPTALAQALGHLKLLKLLVREYAWILKHFDIFRYCLERCIEIFSHIMNDVPRDGLLDIIQLLHENRAIGWSTQTMDLAATYGHMYIVKYLHENHSEGCTTKAMDEAAFHGHIDIVKFLHENRTEGCTTNAMDKAAAAGHIEIVKFLHHNRPEGCTKRAYTSGHFDAVQFLLEQAGLRRKTAIVKYLHEHRHQGLTPETIDLSASMGHFDAVQYLLEHRNEGFTFVVKL